MVTAEDDGDLPGVEPRANTALMRSRAAAPSSGSTRSPASWSTVEDETSSPRSFHALLDGDHTRANQRRRGGGAARDDDEASQGTPSRQAGRRASGAAVIP